MRSVCILFILAAAAMAQTYPTEVWPSDATVRSLNGTSDLWTGLPYLAKGINASSSPTYQVQYDRREQRTNQLLAPISQGRVVQTATLRIGVYPIQFTMNGARHSYTGSTNQGSGTLTAGNGTYYVYIDNGDALQIVASGTGWPADPSQYVPLAEVTVASSAITGITDRRPWTFFLIPQSGGTSITGTDSTFFVLDQDNGGAGADTDLRFNRGSTAGDAALRWNETSDRFDLLADVGTAAFAPFKSLTLESTQATGTAPLTVASTTKVTNLNADAVDGISIGTVTAAGGVTYATSTTAIAGTGAGTSGQVLTSGGSGAPTWTTVGSGGSAIEAWDADLDALAGLSVTGMIARTGTGTAASRTITAGTSIAVSNGDGVSGNPTISVAGVTEFAVAVGTSAGALQSTAAGTDNTVLAARTGNIPTFRKVVNADIDTGAGISFEKLQRPAADLLYYGGDFVLGNGALSADRIGRFLRDASGNSNSWSYLNGVQAIATNSNVVEDDCDNLLTNEGATSKPTITLPSAAAGLCYKFYVQDSDGIKIQAGTGDTIRIAASASAAAGYIESTTVGDAITLVAVNATEWVAISQMGSGWSVH